MLPIFWLVICEDGEIDVAHYDNEKSRDAHLMRELKLHCKKNTIGSDLIWHLGRKPIAEAYEYALEFYDCQLDMKWGVIAKQSDVLSTCCHSD